MTPRRTVIAITIVIFFTYFTLLVMYRAVKLATGSCGDEDVPPNVDPFFEGAVVGENNIFFIESSCATTDEIFPARHQSDSGLRLSLRAACAMEAAARLHPARPVYLVLTCPVRRERIWDGSPMHVLQVLDLPNVRLWPASLQALLDGSPLQSLFHGDFQRSKFPVQHASDLMRLVLLWRYGGTYLDTDVYLLRRLGDLRNFVCVEAPDFVNNAVMDFALDDAGRSALNACIWEAQSSYTPNDYAHGLTAALRKHCGREEFNVEKEEDCHGIRLLPPSYFYPVPADEWHRYFAIEDADKTMVVIRKSIGAHVWNHKSKQFPEKDVVDLRSNQAFAQIVKNVCPSVAAVAADTM